MAYEAHTFNLPELTGLSKKQIDVHLGLYQAYVKHVNLIGEKLAGIRNGSFELDPYITAEIRRRFAFEFDGARLHEYYFEQFEGGHKDLSANSALAKMADEKYGQQGLVNHIKEVAGTRGIGWVITYADPRRNNTVVTSFIGDHELGQLAGLPIILALDLWEHAYMVDYVPAEKNSYVDAFFNNLNWSVVEKRFEETSA